MKTTKKKHQETYKYKSIYEKAINKVYTLLEEEKNKYVFPAPDY